MNAHKANALRKNIHPSRCLCLRNSRRHEAVFTSTDAKCFEHVGYSPRTLRSFPLHPTSCPLCPRITCLHLDTAKGKNGEVFPVTAWRHKGGTQVQLHSLSISILDETYAVNFRPPSALSPGREPRYPLNIRLDGPQRMSGRFGEEKNLLLPSGFEPRTILPMA